MPKSVFSSFTNASEQNLLDGIINEAIDIHSPVVYYLPRKIVTQDNIFREAEIVEFNEAYETMMYIKNIDSFEGDGKLLGKFGIEIRDQMTFQAGVTRFNEDVTITSNNEITKPAEGDLIYIPMISSAYTIMFSSSEKMFYQLGKTYVYDLTCELFEYSNEKFDTGIAEIDAYNSLMYSANSEQDADDEFENPNLYLADNEEIEDEANGIIDFTESNPFGEY